MRIGVTSLFSFRPHVEHLAYVTQLLEGAGHETHALTCDAAFTACYGRLLRQRTKLSECPRCIIGGVRTFPIARVSAVDSKLHAAIDRDRLRRLATSSVTVRYRTEAPDFLESDTFNAAINDLVIPVETAYANTMRWIEKNRLDAVVLFNGRMDVLAGVVAACEDLKIPFLSLERPWLGHGIAMIPNGNCLDLSELNAMCAEYARAPLSASQAKHAGALSAKSFTGGNKLLWRLYNTEPGETAWPVSGASRRVLILPSSRNEFEGHPHWTSGWSDYAVAFDDVMDRLSISSADCVLRCHPSWKEKMGVNTGWRSEEHYTAWCSHRNIHVISSANRASTYDLIAAADLIIVNGSTSGVEAALRGKQVLLVGHATYERSDLCSTVSTPKELETLTLPPHRARETAVKALRYMYVMANRFPQFVRFVRAISTGHCEYFVGADSDRIVAMLRTGRVAADDTQIGENDGVEREVADALVRGDWGSLGQPESIGVSADHVAVERRVGLRWIDSIRDRLPRGDA